MSDANARLHLEFDFDLSVPESLLNGDEAALLAALREILGTTVFGGMPTVTTRQLTKAGVKTLRHRSACRAEVLGEPGVPLDAVTAVAPHLTDAEVRQVARLAAAKLPQALEQQAAHIRRAALKLASHYRLVPCLVHAELSTGGTGELPAQLNLTNGGVLVDDSHKKLKLRADQGPIRVQVAARGVELRARLEGHTLGGPLLAVDIEALVPHRGALLACWQDDQTAPA
jgi:hypothetical protein